MKNWITERTRPKSKAHQKPATENPGTIQAQSIISKALMTRVNNPKVKILIGNVKITRIGLIIALIMPKTTAIKSAVIKLSIFTPGRI